MEAQFNGRSHDEASLDESSNKELVLQKLKESEHFIRHITEAFPDVIVVYDLLKHQYVYVNKAPYSMLGYQQEDLEDTTYEERIKLFFEPEDREKVMSYWDTFTEAADDEVRTLECKAKAKNGAVVWICARGKVFRRDVTGQAVHTLLVLCNITRQKQAEEQLSAVASFQKAILDSAGAIIIATDADGIINLFNPAAEELLGYKAEEVIHKKTPELFHDRSEMLQRAMAFSKELKRPVRPGFETFVVKARLNRPNEHEWTYIRKDGSRFFVSLAITAIRNKEGRITGYLGVGIDISRQKAAEENLQRCLQKEKELNELKSRFVAMASHEFRTPLSTIASSAELIDRYGAAEDHAKRKKHIDRIMTSVGLLTQILDDFLSVGQMDAGKVLVKPSAIAIKTYINNLIQELRTIKRHGQKIVSRHSGDEVVLLDGVLLRHILVNLISNSIKFSPEDSLIEITTTVQDDWFELRVKDQGMGIPKEDQQHLFERFFRGANAQHIQGTGLGLHIVARYTELMKGQVQCKSEPGKGSEFVVRFQVLSQPLSMV